jgi:undecaprenyl-phosphate 4-deoxy-4-formamido-L-arabinose transferase
MHAPALSFVIPLYRSSATIAAVVHDIEALSIDGGHEIILVHDGSDQATSDVCRQLVSAGTVPITLVEHARNYGEHNAVLTGWRHARGAHIVNLDDDGQNPPAEAMRLWQEARRTGLDVVFGWYAEKQHSLFRNLGSTFTTRMTGLGARQASGLLFVQLPLRDAVRGGAGSGICGAVSLHRWADSPGHSAHRIDRSAPRSAAGRGEHVYPARLVRLWLSAWINFSVLPLRVATVLGLVWRLPA